MYRHRWKASATCPSSAGLFLFGFLGPFIGAVIRSVGYKLLEVWMQEDTQSLPVVEAPGPVE
jgi:predicted PurR-regulated permease PerM